ncbi:Glutathione transporter 1 [Exophiala dermatitidis]
MTTTTAGSVRRLAETPTGEDPMKTNPFEDEASKEPKLDVSMGEMDVLDDKAAGEILPYEADNSPFPEVRAVVSPHDDPNLPVNTVRMWTIGIVFTIIGSGLNQFFNLRQPSVTISSLVAQLLSYPVGCAWARLVPLGALNPDHEFNIKEHALITIMANVSFGSAAATQVIEAIVKFYDLPSQGGYEVLYCLTTQLLGFGIAGVSYRWLVLPATMIWPSALSNAALFTTLHSRVNVVADGWKIPRARFFTYVFVGGAIWYFVPGFLFKALSTFSFICWIVPENVVVNTLFGQTTGLGMSMLTLDWAQVVYANQSPLLAPAWAGLNVMGGFVLFFWIVAPVIYYTNTWWSAYMPLMNSNTFDNTGHTYNTSRIMTPEGTVDQAAYEAYSPMFLPAAYALTYGLSFANLTAIFVHVGLYYGKDLWKGWKGTGKQDVHARLMARYRQVPWWWFAIITILMLVLSIVTNEVYHTDLPVWAVFLSFLLPVVYFLPISIIKAISNISTNQLNLITEFIGGYAFLGKPIANMNFKFYGYVAVSQGLEFVTDMKLAHYLHIPPRTVFWAQGITTAVGALVQCGVTVFLITHINGICDATANGGYSCPHGRVTYSSSLIWGALGPGRSYSPGQLYGKLLYFFLVGPLVVVLTWALARRWTFFRFVSWPVIFGGMGLVPPATGVNFSSWWVVNVIFNFFIKRLRPAWWNKYNYVLSAALDCGVAVSTVIIFFCILLPGGKLNWWGNTVGCGGEGEWYYPSPYAIGPPEGLFPDAPSEEGERLSDVNEVFSKNIDTSRNCWAWTPSQSCDAILLSTFRDAKACTDEYFDSLGYQYPFLERADFVKQLQELYNNGGEFDGDCDGANFHYFYHITVAISMHIGSNDEAASERFYRASQTSLPRVLRRENLTALRALLSLVLYSLFSASGPSVWHTLGACIRLVTSMGLHKEPKQQAEMTEAQMRRNEWTKRCFWSVYALDRLISITFGRPLGLADEDVTVDLPGEYNEHWVEAKKACSMSIPLHAIKLRRIFSGIYQTRSDGEDGSCGDAQHHHHHHHRHVNEIILAFRKELDAWRIDAPVLPWAVHYSTSYFDYLYYTTLILLYRPSSANPDPDATCVVGCGDASIQVIRAFYDSYLAEKIKWIPLTLCQIYASGLTLLWCIEQVVKASLLGHRPLPWNVQMATLQYGIDAASTLMREFESRRKGVERLAIKFQEQSARVLEKASMVLVPPPDSGTGADTPMDGGEGTGAALPVSFDDLSEALLDEEFQFNPLMQWFDNELGGVYGL